MSFKVIVSYLYMLMTKSPLNGWTKGVAIITALIMLAAVVIVPIEKQSDKLAEAVLIQNQETTSLRLSLAQVVQAQKQSDILATAVVVQNKTIEELRLELSRQSGELKLDEFKLKELGK